MDPIVPPFSMWNFASFFSCLLHFKGTTHHLQGLGLDKLARQRFLRQRGVQ